MKKDKGCTPKGKLWKPTDEQVRNATKHIAWEYVALLAAALPPEKPHTTPVNHQVQESFLLHLRNLAEFFVKGTKQFNGTPPLRDEDKDNIYAVDLCSEVGWKPACFDRSTRLIQALNKTLSHLTYSRDLVSGKSKIDVAFHGPAQVHGTVLLVRQTWDAFMSSVKPAYEDALRSSLQTQADGLGLSLSDFDQKLDNSIKQLAMTSSEWHLNETPDGPIS